ncbi:TPA: flagellar protein FlaG [Campylobacter coli]|uniref:FlaG family protein n=1 Tax=Campylobacter coli TaxID=195 RepID=UPI0009317BEB|nr:FlaG family protein [Campylobacter coli]EAH8237816.1 flagellar protein FlaG [Campylobacter coli]EAH8240444.1 flagellar protein FlaG [Campylobacter coli]EAH8243073.1 flagellar protein FlaG [Campylobacter coli]EAH8243877.1 flagellar protein FlaG [Campylobacter coli]EAH8247453.1 flagellar protein FlaG [Campylobacter coli]
MEISKANGQLDAAFANLGQRASGVHQTYSDIQAGENKSQRGDDGQKEQGLSEKLADITKKLNEQMDSLDTNVRFGYSDKIGSMYISVTEKSTGREIRQIPSEEAMRLAEYFKDVIGMIFDKES